MAPACTPLVTMAGSTQLPVGQGSMCGVPWLCDSLRLPLGVVEPDPSICHPECVPVLAGLKRD